MNRTPPPSPTPPPTATPDEETAFAVLVLRYIDGLATAAETAELNAELARSADRRAIFTAISMQRGQLQELLAPEKARESAQTLARESGRWIAETAEYLPGRRQPSPRRKAMPGTVKTSVRVRPHRMSREKRGVHALGWIAVAALVTVGVLVGYKVLENQKPEAPVAAAAPLGTLGDSSADVVITRDGKPFKSAVGTNLLAGDSIRVPAGSVAAVLFTDGTRVALQSDTSITLNPAGPDARNAKRVMLERGGLEAEVAHQPADAPMVFATTAAESVVLGTKLRFSRVSDGTRLDVLDGLVRLTRRSDGASVQVAASQTSTAGAGGALVALPLNPPKMPVRKIVSQEEQAVLIAGAAARAADLKKAIDAFEARTAQTKSGTLPYRLFAPHTEPGLRYPLVVFLHGIGGNGTDNVKQLRDRPMGPGVWALPESQLAHPCFVVAPQSNGMWTAPRATQVSEMLDALEKEFPIDTRRLYIIGFSSGGAGAFEQLRNRTNRFAAAISVAGWMPDPNLAQTFKATAVWLFHGSADKTINPGSSMNAFNAFTKAGAAPIYHELVGAGHDIFHPACQTPGLADWLFAQSLGPALRPPP